jgi:hypothetical protein
MPPWPKKTSKHPVSGRAKAGRAPQRGKPKKTGDVIYISDPELLSKYPWLMACDNVNLARS